MVMFWLGFVGEFIILVFWTLTKSPTCPAYLNSLFVLSCKCLNVSEINARSSAKFRSSRCPIKPHWRPRILSSVVFYITQSMTRIKRIGDKIQACLTPVLMLKKSETLLFPTEVIWFRIHKDNSNMPKSIELKTSKSLKVWTW